VVSALLLTDSRGVVGPQTFPPPPLAGPAAPDSNPQPRPLEPPAKTPTEDARQPRTGLAAQQFADDCAYPGMAPSFPCYGPMGMACGTPCCSAPRCTLFARLRAWLHHRRQKSCPWDGCCYCADPCGQCCPGPCGSPCCYDACAEWGDCGPRCPRLFNFFHRRRAPVCTFADPWACCSPCPCPCDGGMTPCQGW
jgi:hypothetical protein